MYTFLCVHIFSVLVDIARSGIAGPHGNSMVYLSAAAAKSLQSCPTLCDPIDGRGTPKLVCNVDAPRYIYIPMSNV